MQAMPPSCTFWSPEHRTATTYRNWNSRNWNHCWIAAIAHLIIFCLMATQPKGQTHARVQWMDGWISWCPKQTKKHNFTSSSASPISSYTVLYLILTYHIDVIAMKWQKNSHSGTTIGRAFQELWSCVLSAKQCTESWKEVGHEILHET